MYTDVFKDIKPSNLPMFFPLFILGWHNLNIALNLDIYQP